MLLVELYAGVNILLHCGKYIILATVFNQLNVISWAMVRNFVAMDSNKTYAGGVNLHKFLKEMKDSRLLPVSMLWSHVLSDRLLSLSNAKQPTHLLNFQIYRLQNQLPVPNVYL